MNTAQWRSWLDANGRTESEIWVDITPELTYEDAVQQALCFGWIDSNARGSRLRFTPRNPRSGWSRRNRDRAAHLIATGQMTPHGQALIDTAQRTGTWEVGEHIPDDLGALLAATPAAATHFARFPPSSKRLILEWIATAKRPETRLRRITQTVALAAEGIRANHPRSRLDSRR
ncbi:YdeI/OmpD-associated family protein [Actinokineospora sp. NPDC004072]